MADLHEYEITDKSGNVYTMQLSDDDAKRFPHARKLSAHRGKAEPEKPAAQQQHRHDQVSNRARRN